MTALLLEEDEEDEKEESEQDTGMQGPGGAVAGDLAHFDALETKHGDESEDEGADAEQEVDAVGSGDEIEEVAVGIGGEEEALLGELLPCDPLADEEEAAGGGGGGGRRGGGGGGGSHSSMMSISRKRWRRPTSMVKAESRGMAVLIQRIG